MTGMAYTKKAMRKMEKMKFEDRVAYLSTAKKVTTGTITQVVKDADGKNVLKTFFVAKIRGCIVGSKDGWMHETEQNALDFGHEVLAKWRTDYEAKQL